MGGQDRPLEEKSAGADKLPATAASPAGQEARGGALRPAFQPGERLSERYLVQAFLARGGMGEVYEVLDLDLAIPVALKTIRRELALDASALRRFKREVLLARSIS